MKNIIFATLVAALGFSCNSASLGLFGKKTPHEKYAEKLDDKGLEDTPEGRQWLSASKSALEDPQAIELPYRHHGFFGGDKPRAIGLQFTAKQGEQLRFSITKNHGESLPLYADLFRQEGNTPALVHSSDTTQTAFVADIEEAGTYILRLQPELYRKGEYSLSVSVGPSLDFPVSGSKAKAGSFWGASRDGGKRRHEGIDIFAPKRTPAVAAADGVVTGVKDGGIGGKVVWLRVPDKDVTLYYAHLDKQLVQPGQTVKKGETLGLVGNTGNAKHTPSHLHFGVYTFSGPIDPWPFVNPSVKTAPAVSKKNLNNYLRLTKTQKFHNGLEAVKANTLLVPVAVGAKGYISELPGGKLVQVPFSAVQATKEPVTVPGALAANTFEKRKEER